MKKVLLTIVFLLFFHNFLFGLEPLKPKVEPKANELAADFSLLDLDGNKVSLSDFKGKPTVLFFWTTRCPYCRKDLKTLNDIHPRLAKDGCELLTIDVAEPTYRVKNFVEREYLNFKVLLDSDTEVAYSYDILGVPTYVFVDKNGHIVFKGHYFHQAKYKDLIKKDE